MNDMKLHDKVLTHKYIDDITLTESISATNKGYLQEAVHTVKEWSDNNNMRLNAVANPGGGAGGLGPPPLEMLKV